jgi:hypothetical protein
MTPHFDGETIQLFHLNNAHTDSDTLVHFGANVIHASGNLAATVAIRSSTCPGRPSLRDDRRRGEMLPRRRKQHSGRRGRSGEHRSLRACHDALVTIRDECRS